MRMKAIGVAGCVLLLGVAGAASRAQEAAEQASQDSASVARADENRGLASKAQRAVEAKRWPEAVELLNQLVKLDPSNEVAQFTLGTALIKTSHYQDAAKFLEALLRKYPDNPAVQNNLAWVYAKTDDPALRNPEKAVQYAQEALLQTPSDLNVWGTLAEAYYASGKYDRAARVAATALKLTQAARRTDMDEVRELYERCRKAAAGQGGAGAAPR